MTLLSPSQSIHTIPSPTQQQALSSSSSSSCCCKKINMATSTSCFLLQTFPHFHCHNHTNKCRFGSTRSKIHSRPLLLVVSSSAAAAAEAGVAAVSQGEDSKYLARESRWGVRRMVKVGEEMRKVAHVQAEAFHTPVALFNDLFFDFFKVRTPVHSGSYV